MSALVHGEHKYHNSDRRIEAQERLEEEKEKRDLVGVRGGLLRPVTKADYESDCESAGGRAMLTGCYHMSCTLMLEENAPKHNINALLFFSSL